MSKQETIEKIEKILCIGLEKLREPSDICLVETILFKYKECLRNCTDDYFDDDLK